MGLLSATREQLRQLQRQLDAQRPELQSLLQDMPPAALPQVLEAFEAHCETAQREIPPGSARNAQALHQVLQQHHPPM